jgi:hypothetical protein
MVNKEKILLNDRHRRSPLRSFQRKEQRDSLMPQIKLISSIYPPPPPKKTSFPFHTPYSLFVGVGPSFGFGGLDTIVARQVAREDHSAAKARPPSSKQVQKRKTIALAPIPPTPTLITPPSIGIGTTSPQGENTQGPSPVDYGLKLEADFRQRWYSRCKKAPYRKPA